jgi:hypothetical protein
VFTGQQSGFVGEGRRRKEKESGQERELEIEKKGEEKAAI